MPLQVPDLERCLKKLLRQIPAGRVATYGDLAGALGDRVAARWVGAFMVNHEHGQRCPCHRVVRADGQLGNYVAGSATAKARRLREEGVAVRSDRVDLEAFRFETFESDRPLEKLKRLQEESAKKARLVRRRRAPRLVGGVDVSYARSGEGVAAYVLVEMGTNRVVWSTTVRRKVIFPYITGYLAFRELPLLLDLIEAVRGAGQGGDVVLV
ncbi:MAG: endonuclease V, partial [Pirellulales bacterium]|nr:endonuclease V [Pirellulales bacterium]